MTGHSCRFCEGPPTGRAMIRNEADAKAYFVCFDARWPPVALRLRGLVFGLDRMARSISGV